MKLRKVKEIAVFDTETTGTDIENDRVVTAYLAVMDRSGRLRKQKDWLIDPGVEVPVEASNIHGVTTEMARKGAPAVEGIASILAALRKQNDAGRIIVAYNGSFDFSLMDREARRHDLDPVHPDLSFDPMVYDKFADKFRPGKRTLSVTAEYYGLGFDGAHSADADAIATGKLAWRFIDELTAKYPSITAEHAHIAIAKQYRKQTLSFQEYKRLTDPDFDAGSPIWPVRPFRAPVTTVAA